MTFRVCLFGNSHLAALRSAQNQNPDRWPDLDLTMIGAHHDRLIKSECDNERFIPSSKAREHFIGMDDTTELALDRFDALFIVGCQFALSKSVLDYREIRTWAMPSVQANADFALAKWQLVSTATFQICATTYLRNDIGGKFLAHLRHGTTRPITVISQPRTSARVMDAAETRHGPLRSAVKRGDGPTLSDIFETTAATLCAEHGAGFLPQPAKTIEDHVLTKQRYTNGAIRLTQKGTYSQPTEDLYHANAGYGALVLDQIDALMRGDLADVEQR